MNGKIIKYGKKPFGVVSTINEFVENESIKVEITHCNFSEFSEYGVIIYNYWLKTYGLDSYCFETGEQYSISDVIIYLQEQADKL